MKKGKKLLEPRQKAIITQYGSIVNKGNFTMMCKKSEFLELQFFGKNGALKELSN